MTIRFAVPSDAAELVPLFEQWGHRQTHAQVATIPARWSSTPLAEILRLDNHSAIAGMAAVSASPRLVDLGYNATLAGLVVAVHSRRNNIGTQLLNAAEAIVKAWGCTRLELASTRTRPAAHEFYRACGYEDTSGRQARYVRTL